MSQPDAANSPAWLADYQALTRERGFVALDDWTSVQVTGNDSQAFLQNFTTNDMKKLAVGQGCEAFLCDVKGKILAHVVVTRRAERFVLTSVAGLAETITAHLDRYLIREDAQLHDATAQVAHVYLGGGEAVHQTLAELGDAKLDDLVRAAHADNRELSLGGTTLQAIRFDWLATPAGWLLEVPRDEADDVRSVLSSAGYQPCALGAFDAARIEARTPLALVDFDDDNLPQEVGRDDRTLSFTKGCYLGQETVARIDALGHVNRRIVAVRFTGDRVPAAGTELRAEEKVVGRVSSATWSPHWNAPLALAMVRRGHHVPGNRLDWEQGTCEVV